MDILGNLKEKQATLQHELSQLRISHEREGLQVTVSGVGEILDIAIGLEMTSDSEHLEDLLVLTLNEALQEAKAKEASLGAQTLQDLMPPGFGNLLG